MLDTSNLDKFLKGITDALRTRKGTTDVIEHKLIDEEILNLSIVDEEDDNFNIIKAILKSHSGNYEGFFADSDINDTQLATFAKEFPNMLGMQYGSSMPSINNLFSGCKNLTVIPKNAFYTDYRGIKGTGLFDSAYNIVAIWVPLRFYCEDSGNNTYYQYASQILPNGGSGNTTLKEIRVAENGIKQSINFVYYLTLSKESYQSIFDGLAEVDTAQTLTLYKCDESQNLDSSYYANATSKGWTVVFTNRR
ncbi:MAG: hypothetical protein PUE60_00195 [Eubacteriales bacterium]|nr:hypothetical protein [Eubacteriales bacterium]